MDKLWEIQRDRRGNIDRASKQRRKRENKNKNRMRQIGRDGQGNIYIKTCTIIILAFLYTNEIIY